MDKYKSNFIKEDDIRVYTSYRYIEDDINKMRIVEIEHIPTGAIVSSEDRVQLQAYKQAMGLLEQRLLTNSKV